MELNKCYPKIGLCVLDAFKLIDWHDSYLDLYPTYSAEERQYGEDYYYETEQLAYEDVESILSMFENMEDPIPIWRAIHAEKESDIYMDMPGDCWSFERDSAISFGKNQNGGNFLLSAHVTHDNVDWETTVKVYFEFSRGMDGYDEHEIRVIDDSKIQDVQVSKIERRAKQKPLDVVKEEVRKVLKGISTFF